MPTPAQIREARAKSGLTQTQFGELIGAALRTVQDWESGQRRMPESKFQLFLHLTGIERLPFKSRRRPSRRL